MEWLTDRADALLQAGLSYLSSPALYAQIVFVAVALIAAWALGSFLAARVTVLRDEPRPGKLYDIRKILHGLATLLPSVLALVMLGIATTASAAVIGEAWLVRLAQGGALIVLVYRLAGHLINNGAIIFLLKWVGIPIALLHVAGLLDDVVAHLDSISIDLGNIRITLYAALRTLLFGVILFWLGRASNVTGQRVIRTQQTLDIGTREVAAKLFEIAIYVLIFLLLVNVMGIDLTALAVFGGALGVGLGFGLQQIASNFISGIIILLDRSIAIGDFIELEDGRSGTLRELTMRSATLETFDGKDIMVPNERFITTAFVNWTHNNKKQRYSLNFQVAYDTDLEKLFELVRDAVKSHPQVLSGDHLPLAERPDAEIASFGDSGINILVEFWMEGVDDGDNRVGADLLLMIWTVLRANGISMPFPQREIRILEGAQGS